MTDQPVVPPVSEAAPPDDGPPITVPTALIGSPLPPAVPQLPPNASNLTPLVAVEGTVTAPTVPAPAPVKPGVTTSEFWLTAATSAASIAAGVGLYLTHRIDEGTFQAIMLGGAAGPAGLYTIFRSVLKIFAPGVDLPAEDPLPQAA